MILKNGFCKYKHCKCIQKLWEKFDLASEFEKNWKLIKLKMAERGFLPYF